MADHSTCTKCGAWADGTVAVCPRCGGPMEIKRGSTVRGWVLLFLGLFLLVFAFGAVSTLYGLFQIVTRRESKVFVMVSLGLALLLLVVMFGILWFMK